MPIPVQCECGHELTVSDRMAGKKGRCPECNGVIAIPRGKRSLGAVSGRPECGRYRSLSVLGCFFTILGLLSFLACAGSGVYTGIRILRGVSPISGPLGLFQDFAQVAADHPTTTGIAFLGGGILVGALLSLFLTAAGQCLRLFVSVEASLKQIGEELGHREG